MSRRDAFEVARILEAHGRALWDAGVRDSRPRQVQLEPEAASWSSLRLRLAACHGMVELIAREPELHLPLVELVEIIQVLDWLSGGAEAQLR
ncbi:MAG: hypothetical protein QM817_12800 [Archangium sp.]